MVIAPFPDAPLAAKKMFGLQLLNLYYADRIEEILNDFAAKKLKVDEQYSQGLESIRHGCAKVASDLLVSGHVEAAAQAAASCNKQSGQLADIHFGQWKAITRSSYEQMRALLEEYWVYSEPYLTDIYHEGVLAYMNDVRRITVYTSLVPYILDTVVNLPVTYAVADTIVPIGTPPPKDLGQGVGVDEVQVPDKDKGKCPFGNNKLKAGWGPVSIALSCTAVEIEYVGGIAVGAALRGKGSGSVFIGVGVQGSAGVATAGAKAGVNITFEQNRVVDVGFKGDVEGGLGYGAGGSASISGDIGVVAPANLDVSGAISATKF